LQSLEYKIEKTVEDDVIQPDMTSILLKEFANLELAIDDPEERFIISGVSWLQYDALLDQLGDSPWYRVTYLEGTLEIKFWQNSQFSLYHLRGDKYEKILKSELLPDLDLALLAGYVVQPDPLEAVLEFREKVRQELKRDH
jgi:hypothetical protein